MAEYFDIRCGDDLDRFARDARPLEVLAQDIYHWLITDRGSLIRDPNWGFGLHSYLSAPLPSSLAADVENGVKRDDRVSNARCIIAPIPGVANGSRLDLQVEVDDQFLTIALELTPSGIARVA
jgi:phage baseplate assembly protein W